MKRTVTIKDVAQKAGCGVATVSRVLNGSGATSAKTRERVFAAADSLGFVFSDIGRSLQSSRTRTLGCIVPSLANPVFADAVQGLQNVAQNSGYQMLLACSNYNEKDETEAVRLLLAKHVDGIVLTVSDVENSAALEMILQREIPACLMFNKPHGSIPASGIDNFAAAKAVAEAFHHMGHTDTGFLALRFRSSDRSRERFEGFAAGCRDFGMSDPQLLEIDEQSGDLSRLLHDLLSESAQLTGIFASNDFLALAAIRAAKELGRRVPEDLSIVGFDGIEIGRMVEPSLATIVTDARAMGSLAARYVLDHLSKADNPTSSQSETETKAAMPALGLSYHFRPGASLDAPGGKNKDGAEAATSTPSRHLVPNPLLNSQGE
ncbi:LacI family DNA-binding transcriptional regulator [uncultured Cohaesibacter sp.]|uniref:LacI family DNA-binding transcriptional regulator n=1 Tax=uncultured Cohaesibacter sp. TaxID=1002546 RepID=UPI0029C66AA0|nr:LacI family DNA-binding transcriptional regulator [uncultured Cohaesibacter sp.]